MEMGSTPLGSAASDAGGGSSDSSLNGLIFGKKIYFEDVGSGISAKSGGGSSSSSSVSERKTNLGTETATGRKGGRRGVLQGGQPPRCQVEGCKLDLSDVKAYYSRHKVCGMHSKSPKVIVAGIEQRFCQQCSRFHQLSEFDQGKRSCRRRLAGHNERRRKPQPGSLFSSRSGRLSSTLQESSNRFGGFLMDFTTYQRMPGRDAWSTARAGNWAPGHHSTAIGKLPPHQWQGISDNPSANVFSQSSHPYLQGSAGGMVFSSSRIPSGECFAGLSDSDCALSLLSNQPWTPRNQSSNLAVNNLMNDDGVSMAQSTAPHGATVIGFTNNTWGFKSNEVSGTSQEIPRDFDLGQVSQPINSHFSGQLELAQQGDRQYMELTPSRAYGSSTQQMHYWSL